MVRRQEIREHVARLLGSDQFVTSRSVTKLLAFCVDAVLAGDEQTLKETTIGVFCFGRTPGYDTKQDPIVRVTARRLRSKLELFYQNEGESLDIRIVLPKGTYIPRFDSHLHQVAATEPSYDAKLLHAAPTPTIYAELPSSQDVFVEKAEEPIAARSSWHRWRGAAGWTSVSLALLIFAGGILRYARPTENVKAPVPQDSRASEPASKAPALPGSPDAHPITVRTDDIAASVEPRL